MASTKAYMGRTTVSEWRDLIKKMGGTPKGRTVAQLQDEFEQLMGEGGGGGGDLTPGAITDEDMDELFGDGQ